MASQGKLTEVIPLRITVKMYRQLNELAKSRNWPISFVLRDLVEKALKEGNHVNPSN